MNLGNDRRRNLVGNNRTDKFFSHILLRITEDFQHRSSFYDFTMFHDGHTIA